LLAPRFRLKFRGIVKEEQKANFISRLHRGKLDIIPWPVIESSEFYKLLSALKKRLDQQPISHPVAGEFLLTIKTLMAKLKVRSLSPTWFQELTFPQANDWGALSRLQFPLVISLISHPPLQNPRQNIVLERSPRSSQLRLLRDTPRSSPISSP